MWGKDYKVNCLKDFVKKYIEKRPWGKYEQFTHNEVSTVKIITVKPKKKLSLQYHKKRREFWKVLSGTGKLTIGNKINIAKEGDEFLVKAKQEHRMEALKEKLVVLEISFGKFDEKDIIRLEDDFGRVK
jgi:mannose-6-phosphate isomerase-like protein (cupin superfamily)